MIRRTQAEHGERKRAQPPGCDEADEHVELPLRSEAPGRPQQGDIGIGQHALRQDALCQQNMRQNMPAERGRQPQAGPTQGIDRSGSPSVSSITLNASTTK